MGELKVRKHAKAKRAGKKPPGVVLARLTDSAGRKVTIRSVDANSPTFGEDFLYVFAQNVKAARRENKAKLGSPSGAGPSGGKSAGGKPSGVKPSGARKAS